MTNRNLSLFIRCAVFLVALLSAASIFPGFAIHSLLAAIAAAVLFFLLSLTVRPLLVLLTLPMNIMTLGFFGLVINAFLLWFLSAIVKGFDISGFGTALLVAIWLWAVGKVVEMVVEERP